MDTKRDRNYRNEPMNKQERERKTLWNGQIKKIREEEEESKK